VGDGIRQMTSRISGNDDGLNYQSHYGTSCVIVIQLTRGTPTARPHCRPKSSLSLSLSLSLVSTSRYTFGP